MSNQTQTAGSSKHNLHLHWTTRNLSTTLRHTHAM